MLPRLRSKLTILALTVVAGAALAGGSLAANSATSGAVGDWSTFGGTVDQNRHSPLTDITPANVGQLGLAYSVDFAKLDPTIKKGQQSFPLIIGGTLYMTTADDHIYALDAATGTVKWMWQPANRAVFKNFGVVANRGVAYCDGNIYLATLDMHLVEIDASTGKLIRQVLMSQAVPNASASFGYSETSPAVCYDHTLLIGAAGSDYGVRGFFMAWKTDLSPAWSHPYWTIPPEQQSWRRLGRTVGGGADWTPSAVDTTTGMVYFDTGPPAPLYEPSLRPGLNPRTDSVIALDAHTGKQVWWQQQLANDQWGYDTSQPPMVYTAKIGGKSQRIVSVATKEGLWFAYDAKTGRPIYQRVKVIDQIEHPSLRPGQPVVIYPSSLGGLNYSPASYDPTTNRVFNAAAETASVVVQSKLTAAEKTRHLLKGDVFLGVENGNFGQYLKGFKDHGSIDAIDVATGQVAWKFSTPEPERGGVTTTASGLGFAGDGDGVLRAFDTKTGTILWHFQTGHQIAAGTSIFTAGGKEYVAITSGGTPTSSNGGFASVLDVFVVGGSQKELPPPVGVATTVASAPAGTGGGSGSGGSASKAAGSAAFSLGLPKAVRAWRSDGDNYDEVAGTLTLDGKPVAGAKLKVDAYREPQATDSSGGFTLEIDGTMAQRHPVAVIDASHARIAGHALTASQRDAVLSARGGVNVGFQVTGLHAHKGQGGIVVQGRVSLADGSAPPAVSLYSYRLTGRVVNAAGQPVVGATVTTRTLDRDYWTLSEPTDKNGNYTSFFTASAEESTDPQVPFAVGVAKGANSYSFPLNVNVVFQRLRSAKLDLTISTPDKPLQKVADPVVQPGAIYQGTLVGAVSGSRPIAPLSGTWPDRKGNFSLVLPSSLAGKTISFYEAGAPRFSAFNAVAGKKADRSSWSTQLGLSTPRGYGSIKLP
ncbi:MAG TPA: PQQ-binding-like beta-propeller repeat protein [Gaiellales bacterium]